MREGRFIVTWEQYQAVMAEIEKNNRWPPVEPASSWHFGKLRHYERLFRLSVGYLDSAKSLCTELGENPHRLDWPRASVICFCFYHSIELFLKACILRCSPTDKLGCHDVGKLLERYSDLYPCDKFFGIQIPFAENVREIAEAIGGPGAINIEDFELKKDQVFRYLSDKEGRSPKGRWHFAPNTWMQMMEWFEDDIDRIWSNILEQESAGNAT